MYQIYQQIFDIGSPEPLEQANKVVSNCEETPNDKSATAPSAAPSSTVGFEESYRLLSNLLERKVYLVLDALDECSDRKSAHLLRSLKKMLNVAKPADQKLKIIICSRPEEDIVNELSETSVIKIEEHNTLDIEKDAKVKLDGLPGLSTTERILACNAIVKKAGGLFRCVDPAIDFLKKPFKRPLEQVLERLPEGLTNSYQQALERTDPQYLELLKTTMHYCVLGKRKPTIAEIMDDFSCAYDEGDGDGDEENPYDRLDSPEDADESKRLIHEQIQKAGSNMFFEIEPNQVVKTRHNTVDDFFLTTLTPSEGVGFGAGDASSSPHQWKLSPKHGHLNLALTICKPHRWKIFLHLLTRSSQAPEFSTISEALHEACVCTCGAGR